MQSNILVDWITFSSKIDSFDSIVDFLGLQDVVFKERSGRYFYRCCSSFGNINIYYDGINDDMGVCVEMSGQGCRDLESYGTGDWMGLFSAILNNPEYNISRLDVACDDFEGCLDLDAIIQDTFSGYYTCKCQHWNVQKGSKGATVEHGSRGGTMYIRIYDKKAERKCTDIDHWVRCELQMRSELAAGFVTSLFNKTAYGYEKNKLTLSELYFQVLNNYLRYVKPPEGTTDINKSRWPFADHWYRFLESVEKRSIFIAPGVEYNMMNLQNFVFNQAGNAIRTYIDLMGTEKFMQELQRVKRSGNPRYELLRNKYYAEVAETPEQRQARLDKSFSEVLIL